MAVPSRFVCKQLVQKLHRVWGRKVFKHHGRKFVQRLRSWVLLGHPKSTELLAVPSRKVLPTGCGNGVRGMSCRCICDRGQQRVSVQCRLQQIQLEPVRSMCARQVQGSERFYVPIVPESTVQFSQRVKCLLIVSALFYVARGEFRSLRLRVQSWLHKRPTGPAIKCKCKPGPSTKKYERGILKQVSTRDIVFTEE